MSFTVPPTTVRLALPRSVEFWRNQLREPLDIHGLSSDEGINEQLARLRDEGLTPSESAAVVLEHCSGLGKRCLELASRAAEITLEGWELAAAEDPEMDPVLEHIRARWARDAARVGIR